MKVFFWEFIILFLIGLFDWFVSSKIQEEKRNRFKLWVWGITFILLTVYILIWKL
jgi:hypothetical protein